MFYDLWAVFWRNFDTTLLTLAFAVPDIFWPVSLCIIIVPIQSYINVISLILLPLDIIYQDSFFTLPKLLSLCFLLNYIFSCSSGGLDLDED